MKIKSLLVANRGEIAVRIMRTASAMGIETWAIKTSREPNAWYLSHADKIIDISEDHEIIPIYLDVEKLIKIIRKHKIDAVHPGYGFLAESPFFAERCEQNRIIFIGPSPDSIYKMGNKTLVYKQTLLEYTLSK